ncbi:tryptophan synthase subunit alpha [uncultured Campylobacter sp.]|uniref:tryptophan synthase subunit alpha n=1 Tax=uncultured Campylobacter sp. TaxID=218934 RepID=UPI002621898D|nr:tryptophan synthase subunit alpha [uncultured Campylobacter sp.]
MVSFKNLYKDKANVAYIVMGYPNLELCEEFLNRLDESDIDIVEIGIPYSDPISDGKIISEAALKALQNGADIEKVFESLTRVKTKKTLTFLVYYNLIFSYGIKKFVSRAKEVGIKGLIVPELIYEENEILFKECKKEGIALIALVSLTTPKARIKKIISRASGFVYAIASIGITGGKKAELQSLKTLVENIKEISDLPVFVGFGIKNAKDVKDVKKICDGAIVGTQIVKSFENGNIDEILTKSKELFS